MTTTQEAGTRRRPERNTPLMHPSARGVPPQAVQIFRAENQKILSHYIDSEAVQGTHIENSRRRIERTATEALLRAPAGRKTTALILGAGNCLDIPLEYLAKNFARVKLVDIDKEGMQKAVQQLPPDLQEKMTIITADISGIVGDYTQGVKKASSSRDFTMFGTEMNRVVKDLTLEGRTPDLGNDNTFVCSQLVMSQLFMLPVKYVQSVLYKSYSKDMVPRIAPGISEVLQREHIALLARSVASEGTVHFADTTRALTPSGTKFLMQPAFIEPILRDNFDPIDRNIPKTSWEWENTPGELSYTVLAYALQPKKG